jgi:hypothetical protein
MLLDREYEARLDGLEDKLRAASAISPGLISDVIAQACRRFAALGPAAKVRVERLSESEAWTDAALALIALELPRWKLRRIIYEDGEWHCSLSQEARLPFGLDDVAEASHTDSG